MKHTGSHLSYIGFLLQWKKENAPDLENSQVNKIVKRLWMEITDKEQSNYENYAIELGIVGKDIILNPDGRIDPCIGSIEKKLQKIDNQQIMAKLLQISRTVSKAEFMQKTFYFIHFNYFTKTLNNFLHIPAEVAVCEYSIEKGIQRIYTTHIIPQSNASLKGIEYGAIRYSKKTHEIPYVKDSSEDPFIAHLYAMLTEFVIPDSQGLYNVYTNVEDIAFIQSCLLYIKKQSNEYQKHNFTVHSIQNLLSCLNDIFNDQKLDTAQLFVNDTNEYVSGISCEYHEMLDRSRFCSKSIVSRWSYMFDRISPRP